VEYGGRVIACDELSRTRGGRSQLKRRSEIESDLRTSLRHGEWGVNWGLV